jgi:hypothetical protein
MPEQKVEIVRIPLREGQTLETVVEIVVKHAGAGNGSFDIAQTGETAFLHVALPDSSALRSALEMRDIAHALIPPLRLDVHAMGLSERALGLTQKLIAGGVLLAGITSNRDGKAQEAKEDATVLRSAKESCASMSELASGYASGVAGEVTIIGDIEPTTYEKAINDAYANALAASASATPLVDRGCTEPCVCRYTVTFAPEATQTTSVLDVKVSASGQKAAVTVSAEAGGSYKTVTAWVRWTLWQTCIAGSEASGAATASGASGTLTVGGQEFSEPCPTRSDQGTVRCREVWTWNISSLSDPFTSQPDDPNKSLLLAREAIRKQVIDRCVEDSAAALLKLDTCPSHCPKIGDASVLIEPPVVTVSPAQKHAGVASIYYEATLTATGGWAVFRPCCPPA